MRNFAKGAVKGVIFVALLIPMLMVCSMIFIPKDNVLGMGYKHSGAHGFLGLPEDSIDVVIAGDSESYRSFSPLTMWEEQGVAAYCCGTPSQKLYYTDELLSMMFDCQSPKVVVLETNTIFKEFSYDDSVIHKSGMVLPVFNHHNRWKSAEARDLEPIEYTHIDLKRGYQLKTKVVEASTKNYMKKSSAKTPIPDRNKSYVKSIKKMCDENGAKLILFSTPSTKNWNMKKHNSIVELADELGIEYIDANTLKDEIPIDWKQDSYDKGDHLNYFGAVKVSTYFAQYVIENDLVSSHTGEPEYAFWDDDVETFHKKVEESIAKGNAPDETDADLYEDEITQ